MSFLILYTVPPSNPSSQASTTYWVFFVILMTWVMVPAGFYWFRWSWQVGDWVGKEVRKAGTPLPSPQEVYNHLWRQLGRPPTLDEVNSFQAILERQKRESQINVGIVAGTWWFLNR